MLAEKSLVFLPIIKKYIGTDHSLRCQVIQSIKFQYKNLRKKVSCMEKVEMTYRDSTTVKTLIKLINKSAT